MFFIIQIFVSFAYTKIKFRSEHGVFCYSDVRGVLALRHQRHVHHCEPARRAALHVHVDSAATARGEQLPLGSAAGVGRCSVQHLHGVLCYHEVIINAPCVLLVLLLLLIIYYLLYYYYYSLILPLFSVMFAIFTSIVYTIAYAHTPLDKIRTHAYALLLSLFCCCCTGIDESFISLTDLTTKQWNQHTI